MNPGSCRGKPVGEVRARGCGPEASITGIEPFKIRETDGFIVDRFGVEELIWIPLAAPEIH